MDNKTAFEDWLLQEALRVICFVFVFVFTKAALKRAAKKENEKKIRKMAKNYFLLPANERWKNQIFSFQDFPLHLDD